MPKINRRSFLKIASATGLASIIPALPAGAKATVRDKTPSQMLWSSLYKKAGNARSFAGATRSMGISDNASRGIYAKLSHA